MLNYQRVLFGKLHDGTARPHMDPQSELQETSSGSSLLNWGSRIGGYSILGGQDSSLSIIK